MGRQSRFPFFQSGSLEDARRASKFLSFSKPANGLPGENCAEAMPAQVSKNDANKELLNMVVSPDRWERE
jgi:hypothetical protein